MKRTEKFARAVWQAWWRESSGLKPVVEYHAIYALCCPVSREVRYVGRSSDPLKRYRSHTGKRAPWNVKQWVFMLRAIKKQPTLIIIEFVEKNEAKKAEQKWISHFRDRVKLL